MLIRHEPKSYCSPKASQSLHWITQLASSSALEAYFVRLGGNALQAWGLEMELRHLRYFVAVAETESLTLAAKSKLHTSQLRFLPFLIDNLCLNCACKSCRQLSAFEAQKGKSMQN